MGAMAGALGDAGAATAPVLLSVLSGGCVSVAIQPALSRLRRCNDRMPGRVRVPGCVAIRGAVATMSLAAFLAGAQVNPVAADLHAFVALIPLWLLDRGDRADVSTALIWHRVLYY